MCNVRLKISNSAEDNSAKDRGCKYVEKNSFLKQNKPLSCNAVPSTSSEPVGNRQSTQEGKQASQEYI